MNNLWHVERLVELRQREIERELEHARLLREAGVQGNHWLARAVDALHRLVIRPKAARLAQRQAGPSSHAFPGD